MNMYITKTIFSCSGFWTESGVNALCG